MDKVRCVESILERRGSVVVSTRAGVNSAPELDFLANPKSSSGIGNKLA